MPRGSQRRNIGDNSIGPEKLTTSFREGRYFYEPYTRDPLLYLASDGNSAPSATVQTKNILWTGFHNFIYQHLTASGDATILGPSLTTDGAYNFGGDQTLGHGFEVVYGDIVGSRHPRIYEVGVDEFFFRHSFAPENVSGLDLYVGIRKVGAFQAAIATYTDWAALRVLGDDSSAAGALSWVTHINDATDLTTTALTSTLADTVQMELEVRVQGVSARGLVNGVEQSLITPFALDDGDFFTPFVFVLNTTNLVGELKFLASEGGLLRDRPARALPAA